MAEESKSLLRLRQAANDAALGPLPPVDVQHTWFRVARSRAWSTLAIVPVHEKLSGLPLAQGLGQMAGTEPGARVLVVEGSLRNCKPATGSKSPLDSPTGLDDLGSILSEDHEGRYDFMDFSMLAKDDAQRALHLAPQLLDYVSATDTNRYTTVIVHVDSPLVQTRAIPVARAADAVIICVSLGSTSFRDAKEVIEIVGRERVIGSIVVR
jgi:hypothetical protein